MGEGGCRESRFGANDMDNQEIEIKLQTLRDRYLKEPNNREIIKRQAQALKNAIEKRQKQNFETVKEIFK